MTQHTISLTDDEQRVVTWLTDRHNALNRTSITPTQFLQAQIPVILRPYAKDFLAAREAAVVAAFRSADETAKQQVETALNIP